MENGDSLANEQADNDLDKEDEMINPKAQYAGSRVWLRKYIAPFFRENREKVFSHQIKVTDLPTNMLDAYVLMDGDEMFFVEKFLVHANQTVGRTVIPLKHSIFDLVADKLHWVFTLEWLRRTERMPVDPEFNDLLQVALDPSVQQTIKQRFYQTALVTEHSQREEKSPGKFFYPGIVINKKLHDDPNSKGLDIDTVLKYSWIETIDD